ncbi:MAG TPA: tryptophan synthase subunit alpha [Trebonia sp.]
MSGNIQLLAGTLARAKQENRAALITYMTAGFPTVNEGIAAIQAMLNSGADIVEVGLPHSDPVLDGPVIQAAADLALRGGVRIADVIRTTDERLRELTATGTGFVLKRARSVPRSRDVLI